MPPKKARLAISHTTQELIKAAESNPPRWEIVVNCLKQGADPNAELIINGYSIKLILYACLDKEYNIVDALILKGAELNHLVNDPEHDFYGCNVFWLAASEERWITCNLLLEQDSFKLDLKDIDLPCKSKKYFNTTAIWWAAYYGNLDFVNKLLNRGANSKVYGIYKNNGELNEGTIPLLLADDANADVEFDLDVWEYILDFVSRHGLAYCASDNKSSKDYKKSILSYAIESLRIDIALELCARFDINKFPENKIELAFSIADSDFSFDRIHKSVTNRDIVKLINTLIKPTNVIHVRNSQGDSFLHHALLNGSPFAKFLIEQWPELLAQKNSSDQSCLFPAVFDDANEINALLNTDYIKVNELDAYGNSPLYYATITACKENIRKLVAKGARCIRHNKEIKNALHFAAAYEALSPNLSFDDVNALDESGRTPLHYSLIYGRDFVSANLLQKGARTDIQDQYGYTARHFAIMESRAEILRRMPSTGINMRTRLGVSAYTLACYSNNPVIINLIGNNKKYVMSTVDEALQTELNLQIIKRQCLPKLTTLEEKLCFLSGLKGLHAHDLNLKPIIKYVLNQINRLHFSCAEKYPSGRAFGIELEFANMPSTPLIPYDDLLEWFSVEPKYDGSVVQSSFMTVFDKEQELNSQIIDTPAKMLKFLTACKYLHQSGAKVNYSTGFHVHVNINGGGKIGYIDDCLNLPDEIRPTIRWHIIQQILLNWSQIEPMLCAILRDGKYYNADADFNGIQPRIAEILKCRNIEELQELYNYQAVSPTVSVLSLYSDFKAFRKRHGTLEFRMHQGTADPVLISAWVNLISRLVDLSVQQVNERYVKHLDMAKLVPYKNIEYLVYMLLAERRYQDTWDNAWKTHLCNYDYGSDSDLQRQMQISPLYLSYQARLNNQNANSKLDKAAKTDLQIMLDLNKRTFKVS